MERSTLLGASLWLAACGAEPNAAGEDAFAAAAEAAGKIECAVDGATAFEWVCTIERTTGPDGVTLTLRSPSGGFRRLLVTGDGRGVVAADGAEQAIVTPVAGNRIEVAVAGDRYRLPATVRP